jgi:hypothetical protein
VNHAQRDIEVAVQRSDLPRIQFYEDRCRLAPP